MYLNANPSNKLKRALRFEGEYAMNGHLNLLLRSLLLLQRILLLICSFWSDARAQRCSLDSQCSAQHCRSTQRSRPLLRPLPRGQRGFHFSWTNYSFFFLYGNCFPVFLGRTRFIQIYLFCNFLTLFVFPVVSFPSRVLSILRRRVGFHVRLILECARARTKNK